MSAARNRVAAVCYRPERPDTTPWDGTSAGWLARLTAWEDFPTSVLSSEDLHAINRAERSGYYVSAMNDKDQRILCEGPFQTHAEALVSVPRVSRAWGEIDIRAPWYAWGTARVYQ